MQDSERAELSGYTFEECESKRKSLQQSQLLHRIPPAACRRPDKGQMESEGLGVACRSGPKSAESAIKKRQPPLDL